MDGKFHSGSSIGAAIGIGVGYGLSYYLGPEHLPPIILGTIIAGKYLGPDLDHDAGNISYHYFRKIMKSDFLWTNFWRPYRYGFKHRSFWSHFPIFSTIIRIVYLFFPIVMILIRDQKDTPFHKIIIWSLIAQLMSIPLIIALFLSWWYYFYVPLWILGDLFLGFLVSDILHAFFDI